MQPNRDESEWQQPHEQPSQAPYVAPLTQPLPPTTPLVIPTPDEAEPAPVDAAPLASDGVSVDSSVNHPEVDNRDTDDDVAHPAFAPVRWQAYEHIVRDKNQTWYIVFGIITALLVAIAIFIIQSFTFALLIPVMAASLVVYVKRPPHLIDYTLSRQGLHINDHLNPFTDFKAFGVIHDDDEYSVLLIPTKRFKPGVSVYFPEVAGEAIVDMLAARLPMRELRLDFIDRLTRKLRI